MFRMLSALAALLVMGCVNSSEVEKATPSPYLADGEYQSKDNALLLTIDYPNWSAHYYALNPNLFVSGTIDSVHFDTTTGLKTREMDKAPMRTSVYFHVGDFYQKAQDGTVLKTDTSVVISAGFRKYSDYLFTSAAVLYETVSAGVSTIDSTFTFTGHKIR